MANKMRMTVGLCAGLCLSVVGSAAQAAVGAPGAVRSASSMPNLTQVEYFCSPGFEPSYGGTCVAVPSRAEVELFVDQPIYESEHVVRRTLRHHRRRGLQERY